MKEKILSSDIFTGFIFVLMTIGMVITANVVHGILLDNFPNIKHKKMTINDHDYLVKRSGEIVEHCRDCHNCEKTK